MKEVLLVISIHKASNWEEDGVWVVRLGLDEIAGISQHELDGLWSYTLWDKEHSTCGGFKNRVDAAFQACSAFLKRAGTS